MPIAATAPTQPAWCRSDEELLAATAIGGALLSGALGAAGTASATPPCPINWELDSTGHCKPYYSTTTGGCDLNTTKRL
jgi:hypothetical protein